MKRAIRDLADFPDDRLFMTVAEGIPLIVENAVELDGTAGLLYERKEYRVAEIIRGLSEEEAAKVLILLDAVRCPPKSGRTRETLNCFDYHLAKRIYSMTCSYPSILSYKEIIQLVQIETRSYFLDGPNRVDWILENSITAEREESLYVDFVQDLTETAGEYQWRSPRSREPLFERDYRSPDCVRVVEALCKAGAKSSDGVALIAEIWRGFSPDPSTQRSELQHLIADTLDSLLERGLGSVDASSGDTIMSGWSFPLWPFTIKPSGRTATTLRKLREERARAVARIEAMEEKRNPPPAITRSKLEALAGAYAAVQRDRESLRRRADNGNHGVSRSVSSAVFDEWFESPSYLHLRDMYRALSEKERTGLLALGWFAKERITDWSLVYERARDSVSHLGEAYQLGLGYYWLAGLARWEAPPRPFQAGRWNPF